MSEDVTVTRGWGDRRRLAVPEEALSGFHFTSFAGGTQAPLPRPCLASYMSCERIPDDVEFGHSCQHGEAPHSIKVLIMKSHNPAAVYRRFARQGGFGGDGMSERDKSPYRRPESIGGYPVDRERQCEANTVKGRGCRNSPVVGGRFCPCHLDPNPRGTPSPKMEAARRVFEKLDEDQLRAFQTGTREFEERMRELIDKQRRSRHADETG